MKYSKFEYIYIDGIKSKYVINKRGMVINTNTQKRIKWHFDGKYYTVRLTQNNITRGYKVHRLVAQYFIPNDRPGIATEVNHIDGNKYHSYYSNLEWVTPSENCRHACITGLKPKTTVLTIPQVHQVCELLVKGLTVTEIANIIGCRRAVVKCIKNKQTWIDISKNYF